MQEHEKWLTIAHQDLHIAKLCFNDTTYAILAPAFFSAQQCAEKSMKAYLVYKKMLPPKIHDLIKLLQMCVKYDKEFGSLLKEVSELNPYSITTRYPDELFSIPDKTTLKITIEQAEKILHFIEYKIQIRS